MRKLLLSAILGWCSFFAIAQNEKVVSLKTEVVTGTLIKVTAPLRNFKPDPDWKDIPVRDLNGRLGPKHNDVSPKMHPDPKGFTGDPALQKSYGNPVGGIQTNAAIGVNIEGIGNQPVNPPDPTMAVGPNHVVQMINGNSGAKFKIFNKAGVAAGPDIFMDALTGRGGLGDPIVLYDQLADRFVMTEFAEKSENGNLEGLIIAISQTPDPTGSWYVYFFSTGTTFPDYPKFSVWPDAYYATTNDFAGGSTYDGSSVYAFDRTKMLAGNPTATMQKIKFSTTVFTRFFTMCPVLLQGTTIPPAGTGGLIAYLWDDGFTAAVTDVDSVGIMEMDVDFTTPANTSFSIQASLVTAAFKSDICAASRGRCISQPTSAIALEALQQRVMNQPIYRKFGGYEGIVFTHVVDKGSNISAPRWYELRKTTGNWGIHQQQTYSPDNTHRFMPSIAYNAVGNIALAYNVSSSANTVFPGIRYTGRMSCDPLNTMTVAEAVIIAGTASNASARYGDYNHLICDPNEVSFWVTGEYNVASTWSTRITSFTLNNCAPALCGDPTGLITTAVTQVSATVSWAAVVGAVSYDVDYKTGASAVWINAATGTAATSVNLGSLVPKEGYVWRVRANCAGGAGNYVVSSFITPGPLVTASGSTVTAASCNGITSLDPGETITVDLSLTNSGTANTGNITATLLATGGVTNPSGPQNYGVLNFGGPAVSRPFTFTLNGTCGGIITATLQVTDGVYSTTVTYTFTLGTTVPTPLFSENFDGVTSPALPAGWTTAQTGATPPAVFATTATTPNSTPNAAFTNGVATVASNSLVSPVINVPVAGTKQLSFSQTLNFEDNTTRYDGAVLEVSTDGGTSYADITDISIGGSFTANSYTGTIGSADGNPLAGRSSWGGVLATYQTVGVLLPSGFGGANIKFRWRAGWDNTVGNAGANWRIDNISLVQNLPVCSSCPEIDITGNSISIADGDATPSLADHTDFGNVNTGNNLVRTYTVNNTGTANLTISSIGVSGADMGLFTVGALTPAGAIAPAGSATFTVTFAPTTAGLKTATITVNNNDANEAAYDFAIQGNSVAPCSNVTLTGITAGQNPICENVLTAASGTSLTATGVGGTNAVLTWYTGPGGTGSNLGNANPLFNAGPGTYYARVTGDCGGPLEQSITITAAVPAGIGGITAGQNPVPPAGTTSLTANSVTGTNAVLTWYTGPNGTGTNLGSTNPLTNRGVGTYYASVTTDCGNPVETSITITQTSSNCSSLTNRIYVDASNAMPGNGSSWACAINELSVAIAMANANPAIKSIWVADGTYKPTTGTDRSATMTITRSDLQILGGFSGSVFEILAIQANPAANPAIISGEIGAAGNADNSYHLFVIHNLAASANGLIIDGFTLQNGNATDYGAAVVAYSNNPATLLSFRRCRFTGNNSSDHGGAIGLIGANLTLDRCMLTGNSATNAGGAIYSYASTVTASDCVFANNTAMQGGAVYGNFGMPVYNRSVFTGNAAGQGGAVYQNSMNTMYNNCVFNANSSSAEGGALYVHNQSVAGLNNSTLFNNIAVSNGGAVLLNFGGSVVAQNSIFWKNAVNGNMTAPGAGVHNPTNGANVYANCMLQANTSIPADNGINIRNNVRGVNPMFFNEANPLGGDARWATADDGLNLSAGSPAVNTGDNALVPPGTDIKESTRIQSGTADRGAYEFPCVPVGIVSATAAENPICPGATTTLTANGVTGYNATVNWWRSVGLNLTLVGTGPTLIAGPGNYLAIVTGDCGLPIPAIATVTVNTRTAPTCGAVTNRLYVDANNCFPGNGSSWACAITELSAAIAIANGNPAITSIWVADGIYKPTTTNNRSATMILTRSNLVIRGGFAGGEMNAAAANPAANPAIISGEIGAAGIADNSYHLFVIHNLAASANGLIIDGFTLENGNATDYGAAVIAYSNNPATLLRFRRCRFTGNNSSVDGGAIGLIGASLTLDRCMLTGNSATNAGGAIYSYESTVTASDCVFANNTAMQGGAVYGNFGVPVYNRSVFTGNAAAFGGAVYQNRMNTMYNNCVFNANSSSAEGGALYVHNQSVAGLNNSTLFKNAAVSNGGAVLLNFGGSVVAQNSIFWKNAVNGNMTAPGAGVHNITNGANVYANCMLQANTSIPADNGINIRNNMRGIDPLFTNEANPRGADAMWSTADDGLQLASCNPQISIALPGCSPAINTGDNALVPGGADLNNNPRVVCTIVDRGAYENQDCAQTNAPQREVEFTKLQSSSNSTAIVANPFSNELQIRYMGADKAGITVYSASGQKMWSRSNIAEGTTKVNTTTWSGGMYQVVLITASGKIMNFKVVRL